jgi:hypothetical protein
MHKKKFQVLVDLFKSYIRISIFKAKICATKMFYFEFKFLQG